MGRKRRYDRGVHPLMREMAIIRQVRAMSQRELAERTGTSQAYISELERGVLVPSVAVASRLGDVLGVRLAWLTPEPAGDAATIVAGHEPHCAEHEGDLYFCPTSGEVESPCHGGFDVCCDKPELHRAVIGTAPIIADGPTEHFVDDYDLAILAAEGAVAGTGQQDT